MNRTLRKMALYIKQIGTSKVVEPPYQHVCQTGDPVLRHPARLVEPELIKTKEFQYLVNHMVKVMRDYEACGLAAPQIGVPMQIFAAELPASMVRLIGATERKTQEIEVIPLKVFINPKMKIIDYGMLRFREGCVSTVGFEAEVSRYKEVLITGLDPDGKTHEWHAKNWAARVAQHEMDHLNGILFTDKMEPTTLSLSNWQEVNTTGGNLELTFKPQ